MGGVGSLPLPLPRTALAAGQASVEYVAVVSLLVAVMLAAPAAGAGDIPRAVVHGIRLGICLVASDVCSDAAAKAAGLGPCPLSSHTGGGDGGVTVFSADFGARGTLTMTQQSDGTVAAALAVSGRRGVSGGLALDVHAGPLQFDAGVNGTAGIRLTAGRGWIFPDSLSSQEFAKHLPESLAEQGRYPPSWVSAEGAADLSGSAGLSAGDGEAAGELVGGSAGGEAAAGFRYSPADHALTSYLRAAVDAPELTLPLLPSQGGGRTQWLVEYTRDRDGPRELVFRHADPSAAGNRVTETVARLNLRVPANWAVAAPLVDEYHGPAAVARAAANALRRIRAAGVTERYVSTVSDHTSGLSLSFAAGVKFSVDARKVDIDKRLVAGSAWTPGSGERERFDCADLQRS
jgi:hypothetical protein